MATETAGKIIWDLDVELTAFTDAITKATKKIEEFAAGGEKEAKKVETAFEKVTKQAKNVADGMDKAGKAMIGLGAAPTLALLGIAKAGIDFESSFAGVRKTVDLSEEGFAKLSQNLRNIAKEAPVSVNELNGIAELAGQLGISGVDNLTKFTDTITKFTTATGIAGETAASNFARIANVMQEPIDNIDKMGSVVAKLGDSSAATEGEILDFAERIAGAGKIAGLSTANVFAIGSAMASVGVEAEAGGTAVQKVLISMYQAAAGSTSKIIDNSKAIATNNDKLTDMKKALAVASQRQKEFGDKTAESTKMANASLIEKYNREIGQTNSTLGALNATQGKAAISGDSFAKVLGITNKQFQELFKKDPEQAFTKFVEKLGEISKKGGDAAGVLEGLELGDQRLIRSFLSLSNAGSLLADQVNIANQEWTDNNRLNEEAEKRYKTTASQIKIAQNRLYDIGITISSAVLPPLNDMLLKLKPIIDAFANFAAAHPRLIAAFLGIGAAVGILGVGFVALAGFINSIVTIAGTIVAIAPAVGTAFSIMFGPVGLIVLAVAALAGGLIYLATQTDIFKSKQDALKDSNDKLKASADALKDSENKLSDARFNAQGSALAVERAQDTYNKTLKKYGDKALETREAAFNLEQATRNHEDAVKKVDSATKDYDKTLDADKKAQTDHQETVKKTESAWWGVKDAIGGALANLGKWIGQVSSNALKGGAVGNISGFAGGVRNFNGGMAVVGESGPELVNLPGGSDVFSNRDSRNILSDLADSRGGGISTVINIDEMNVQDQTDIDGIARELGFRIEYSTGFTNG
jgi:TP901 family phage tail tape measure protein